MTKASRAKQKDFLKTPKGTRDILPEEAAIWLKIEERAREVAEYYGFLPIRTPHFEHTELFTASLGEATDIVEKQMYSFRTRGGDALTLRPEGTAPIMRSYIEHGMRTWPQPVMLYYCGSFFRHETPQRGRYRELGQFGLEILGDESAIADALVIRALSLILEEVGAKDYLVHINTLGDKECRAAYRKELVQYLRKNINYLCKDCKQRVKTNPMRVLDCKNEECAEIKEGAPQALDYVCQDCKAHFKEVLEYLDEMKIPYFLNHYLVRGLDYYSRTVFEIVLDGKKQKEAEADKAAVTEKKEGGDVAEAAADEGAAKQLALAGGGRYDYLAQNFGIKNVPSAGGAIGLDRLADVLKETKVSLTKKKSPKLFLIQLGTQAKRKSLVLIEGFRKANIPIAKSFSRDSISSQLKIASKLGVKFSLIIGQKEAFDETVIVRAMDSGNQETIPLDKIMEYIKKLK